MKPYDSLSVLKQTAVKVVFFLSLSTVEFSLRLCCVFISVMREFDSLSFPHWNAVNVCMLRSVKELPHLKHLMPNSRNKNIGMESKVGGLLNSFFFCFNTILYKQVWKQDTNCQFNYFILWTVFTHVVRLYIFIYMCISCQIIWKGLAAFSQLLWYCLYILEIILSSRYSL